MPRISLRPSFLIESFRVLKNRGLKQLIFGVRAKPSAKDTSIIKATQENFSHLQSLGAKKGTFQRVDTVHKGSGMVYLTPGDDDSTSRIVFSTDMRVTNGPDMWLYVSTTKQPKKELGEFIDLGLIHANKGGQVYTIDQPITEMQKYHSIIIYCKQFEVRMTYAILE